MSATTQELVFIRGEFPGVMFRETSLELSLDISFEKWLELGTSLHRIERAAQWWIADLLAYGKRVYGETYREASAVLGYDTATLKNYVWIAQKFPPSLRKDIPFTHYLYAAGLKDEEKAQSVIEEACKKGSKVRETLSLVRRLQSDERFGELQTQALPKGVFQIVVADPPWRYERGSASPEDSIESRYPTMSTQEIASLPVPDLAAEDAMLFLWAPPPKLPEALSVIEAWQFEYRTNVVWVKDTLGLGWYVRQRHEHLLLARRGLFPVPQESCRPESVLFAPRGEHSEKPEEAYSRIERAYPGFRYLELFSRKRRPKWEGWGSQYPTHSGVSGDVTKNK